MGIMMKNDGDLLTIQIRGDGPIQGLTVTADAKGRVKGYAFEPDVEIPANAQGKLDVAGALGNGILNVIRDTGMKEPYVGQTILVSGEIAEDLTYYFATSEQVPSSVAVSYTHLDVYKRQGVGYLRGAVLSTRGPGWTDRWCIGCTAKCMAE